MISMITLSLLAAAAPGIAGTTGASADGGETAGVIAQAIQAHAHLMRGDIDAYRRSIELAPDFLLMDPFGGVPTGLPRSEEHWRRIGRYFRGGRNSEFQPIRSYRSDDMIVLVANERTHVAVGSLPAQDWALRVTLVFRRDEGVWRLVHRHADPLVEGISPANAARITLGELSDRAGE
jgi:ketosteroid isomerase-like protein